MELNEEMLKDGKFSRSQIKSVSKAFWRLVEKYNLSNPDLKVILGKNLDSKTIKKYKNSLSLPEGDTDIILRAIHMLSIHWSLRVIYPYNPSLVYSWMKTESSEFNGKSPMQILRESGYKSFIALMSVRNYLDYKRSAS